MNNRVAILLCTYNGQSFLRNQLDSFAAQTHQDWTLHASDDGSSDQTLLILSEYRTRWGFDRVSVSSGPRKGAAANFLHQIRDCAIKADYYAYSDQDDVWEPGKLERALSCLANTSANKPALYCSRTRLVDIKNHEIGLSPLFTRPPSFANALVQNIGGGNTMVFNHSTRVLLSKVAESAPVVMHDWLTYQVASGCGGGVLYDSMPTVRYRQHGGNLIGNNSTWLERLIRIGQHWQGLFAKWNDSNIDALQCIEHHLSEEAQNTLRRFATSRKQPLRQRLVGLWRSGIYRQTFLGTLGLIAAGIFKKL